MNEEKMKILKMLEEGRISAADAARLLESLGDDGGSSSHRDTPPKRGFEENRSNRRASSSTETSGSFDSFASDITKKFENLAKDMEPHLQRLSEVVAEKTVSMADRISKTLTKEGTPRETAYREAPRPYSAPAPNPVGMGSEKMYEALVTASNSELDLAGLNGNVTVKGYNGDKITAKIYAKPKRPGAAIEILQLGCKYMLHYDEDLFESVAIDAYVPETLFGKIGISTINGAMDVSGLQSKTVNLFNSNGITAIQNIKTESIGIDCNNGRLDLTNLIAENGQIENFNGDVTAADIDIANMKLVGSNGSVTMLLRFLNRYTEYAWAVETSNGRLMVNLPTDAALGFHIKAHAALSQIKIGLTGLNYAANSASYVEAKSFHYETAPRKMKLSLETSNGPLTLN